MEFSINQEYSDQRMSHGNVGAKALKDYSKDEFLELAILARKSQNPALIRCFNEIPPLSELLAEKMALEEKEIQANSKPIQAPTPVVSDSKVGKGNKPSQKETITENQS